MRPEGDAFKIGRPDAIGPPLDLRRQGQTGNTEDPSLFDANRAADSPGLTRR